MMMPDRISLRLRAAALAPRVSMPPRADWIFALRSTAAGLVALAIAQALGLEQPQWAMMTVFIVSQPVAGMVLAKGLFRLGGTLAGALASIAMVKLTGAFHPAFVATLAIWIAMCTYVASILRNPESYGAVLAGYTVAIIGLPAYDNAALVTDLATARCIEIMLGIACAGIASRLFLPQLARDLLVERVGAGLRDIARYASGAMKGTPAADLDMAYQRLIVDIEALAAMRAYARLEAPGLVTHGRMARHTIGHMLSSISAIHTLLAHASAPDSTWRPLLGRIAAMLDEMVQRPWQTEDVRPWLRRIEAAAAEAQAMREAPVPAHEDRVGAAARLTLLVEFLAAVKAVLHGLAALRLRAPDPQRDWRPPALLIDRDKSGALINATRAAIATAIVTAYWIATRWADLGGAAVMVSVVSSLFATMPNPMRSAFDYFKGGVISILPAFVVGQLVLPALPGFGWVLAAVTPVLVPAALMMANPRFSSIATSVVINFLLFVNPHQPMVAAPGLFVNAVAAVLGGILLSLLVFMVVLPPRPERVIERVVEAFRADLTRLCLHDRLPKASAFESLAYDRINQLMAPLERVGGASQYTLDGSLAAVSMGLEILRLRRLAAAGELSHRHAGSVTTALGQLAHLLMMRGPHAKALRDMILALRTLSAGMADGHASGHLQAAASLRVIAAVLEDHPLYF
ncbi:FUSC family protein [Labrys monachus]|uniref:Membrane protein YccC n=1 Tax=Labrys monachus TaxID=217067 RepID=A0ABU0F811_9HYPH|nr:FUSC family protein [Labrys monachus]MDQ0390742.1 putative membrane protein YccC [Labrys monachus]